MHCLCYHIWRQGRLVVNMSSNILLIAGSRDFNDYELLCRHMNHVLQKHRIDEIISGGARGADSLGERYAKEHNIPFKLFPANWDLYGKRAGYLRNVEMGKYCKAALIFWDGESKGTQHMINILKAKNKKFVTIKYGG